MPGSFTIRTLCLNKKLCGTITNRFAIVLGQLVYFIVVAETANLSEGGGRNTSDSDGMVPPDVRLTVVVVVGWGRQPVFTSVFTGDVQEHKKNDQQSGLGTTYGHDFYAGRPR